MKYRIELEKSAQKFLRKQDKPTQSRIIEALAKLPHEGDIKLLKGTEKKYRLRIGSMRAIYRLEQERLIVDVLDIDNRGQVYKRREI